MATLVLVDNPRLVGPWLGPSSSFRHFRNADVKRLSRGMRNTKITVTVGDAEHCTAEPLRLSMRFASVEEGLEELG